MPNGLFNYISSSFRSFSLFSHFLCSNTGLPPSSGWLIRPLGHLVHKNPLHEKTTYVSKNLVRTAARQSRPVFCRNRIRSAVIIAGLTNLFAGLIASQEGSALNFFLLSSRDVEGVVNIAATILGRHRRFIL